ncbi:MAG TPA: HNH endonuclease signature motif containing protein, partial [Ruania sp.]|nr:HNH endonuclease signature motif containing protein [Ruania sp.]
SQDPNDQIPTWPPPLPGQHLPPDQVPLLEGYGPITPTLARALAAGGNWYRIITDPLTGAVLDVGHTRYRPTQAMINHILARDSTCARPGCTHRAIECQLDHTQEWNHTHPTRGGPTNITNLAPLCGRDHQVKTHGDFHLTQTGPGAFEWTTPTGHHYRREPDATTTLLSHPDHLTHDNTTTIQDTNDQPHWGPPPF